MTAKIDCSQSTKYTKGFYDRNAIQIYIYDANDSLIFDPDKQISIRYNHLNLPYETNWSNNSNQIQWLYTADGTKLRKTVSFTDSILSKKDYLKELEYQSDTIEAIYHSEGRVVPNGSTWDYSYSLKDHLGNTRVVFKEDGVGGTEIVTTAAYYPFGSEIEDFQKQSNPLYSYLYNGKELDSDFGLNYYHYGARIYDPIKGRFISIDPISDQFAFVSPYNYAENKPINSIDLHGLQAWEINFDRRRLDQKPPKRSEKDWMGPAIGGALTGMTFFIPGPEDFVLAGIATKSLQVAKSFNVSAKALKGLGITKDAIKVTEGVSDQITVIGEGMKRVLGFADELGEAGAKNINTFKPSEGALKEWDELTEGGKYLSDDLVKETKIFKENKQWINEAKESGSTIVDIGDDGRKKASSFYEMEKQTVYE